MSEGVGVSYEAVISELHKRYTALLATSTQELVETKCALDAVNEENERLKASALAGQPGAEQYGYHAADGDHQ